MENEIEAQAGFSEALEIIAGVERKVHYLAMNLPHSDASWRRFRQRGSRGFLKAMCLPLRNPMDRKPLP